MSGSSDPSARAEGDRGPTVAGFYGDIVDRAELLAARAVEGVDEELAVLRVILRDQLRAHPEDYKVAMKSIELIVRTVVTRYRMSSTQSADLAEAIAAAVKHFNEQMMPSEI